MAIFLIGLNLAIENVKRELDFSILKSFQYGFLAIHRQQRQEGCLVLT
jgi:hypothetical protein